MELSKAYLYNGEWCVRASDFLAEGQSDSDAIEKAMIYSAENHINTILIDKKTWFIDKAILLRSNIKVIVDGVMIKQIDGVLDNIFRPDSIESAPGDPYGFAVNIKKTENIKIIGKNGAVLEGPEKNPKMYHPVLKQTMETFGDHWGWRGFIIFFTRCTGFEISGFLIQKTRSWAITTERSTDGYIHDIEIYSDCKNGDGINLRVGSKRIFIENIKGRTSDDFIAINTLASETRTYPFKNYVYTLFPSDYLVDQGEPIEERYIHDIFINNIVSATNHYSQAVAFLTRQGHKIFRIFIHGVYDGNTWTTPKRIDMVGAYYMEGYGDINIDDSDLAEIRIDKVVSNSTDTAVLFRNHVKDLWINDVTQNCPEGVVLSALDDELTLTNCKCVSGVYRTDAKNWKFIRR
ncbi:MAG: hypothetical protein E7665_08555 [Ruminococcaceae bacterium]|nr:hypothetical protein [Oscillospiraceae bacterium]